MTDAQLRHSINEAILEHTEAALIEAELKQAGLDYVILTGDTVDRETPVRRFQAGEVPIFLISLKAGGVGLNLTAADTVIHVDPWWNPAVEAQASARAHRIGQDKPVFVYKLIARGSLEEKIQQLQQSKASLALLNRIPGKASINKQVEKKAAKVVTSRLAAAGVDPVKRDPAAAEGNDGSKKADASLPPRERAKAAMSGWKVFGKN